MFFFQTHIFLQPCRCKGGLQLRFLFLQLIHTILGALVEDTGFNGPEQVCNCLLRFSKCILQGFGITGICILRKLILVSVFCNVI